MLEDRDCFLGVEMHPCAAHFHAKRLKHPASSCTQRIRRTAAVANIFFAYIFAELLCFLTATAVAGIMDSVSMIGLLIGGGGWMMHFGIINFQLSHWGVSENSHSI